jgi:hypothetical protein
MADLAELEARIRILEDIEAIKKLKAKYFRCANAKLKDKKVWDELTQCFSEDAVMEYPGFGRIQGTESIIQSLKQHAARFSITIHEGHDPEIDVVSDTTARATWGLHFYAIDAKSNTAVRMWALYDDKYIKEKGKWKIKNTKSVDIFSESLKREG